MGHHNIKLHLENAVQLLREHGYHVKPNGWDGDTMYIVKVKTKKRNSDIKTWHYYVRKNHPGMETEYAEIKLSQLAWRNNETQTQ